MQQQTCKKTYHNTITTIPPFIRVATLAIPYTRTSWFPISPIGIVIPIILVLLSMIFDQIIFVVRCPWSVIILVTIQSDIMFPFMATSTSAVVFTTTVRITPRILIDRNPYPRIIRRTGTVTNRNTISCCGFSIAKRGK